jgi:hypothetical protein
MALSPQVQSVQSTALNFLLYGTVRDTSIPVQIKKLLKYLSGGGGINKKRIILKTIICEE